MIKITVDEQVLRALSKAMAGKTSKARALLNDYVALLEDEIWGAMQRPTGVVQANKTCYYVDGKQLLQKGGQTTIDGKRQRLHSWLKDNKLALIKTEVRGNNITKQISLVSLTSLVTVTDLVDDASNLVGMTDAEVDTYLDGDAKQNAALFARLYPDFVAVATDGFLESTFDYVQVDAASLKNYIEFLVTEAKMLTTTKKQLYIRQAKLILAVVTQTKGYYIQRKKPSIFGRMYYAGLSVQNVNKELRRAMLGDCWEYDVRSSVIAWKMGFAKEYLQHAGHDVEVRKAFSATTWYLEDKAEFMQRVIDYTFDADNDFSKSYKIAKIKEAMTALSFGARLKSNGWRLDGGEWAKAALEEIIKDKDERDRFVKCVDVRDFVREQNTLDTYLYEAISSAKPKLLKQEHLRTKTRPSKAKVIAYLYQSAETENMRVAHEYLVSKGHEVLAKIHDAFIVRDQLVNGLRAQVELAMREASENDYWRLGEKKLERYGAVNSAAKIAEAEHKQRIADEQAKAEIWIKTQ